MTETEHTPEYSRIPESLQRLSWHEMPLGGKWEDGTRLLVVVPVVHRGYGGWFYRVSSIMLHCAEGRLAVTCESGPWGWDLESVDYYVEIK